MTQITTDYVVLARDGENYIVARKSDAAGGGENYPAMLYNANTGSLGEPMPLQVFFKWGNFVAPDKTVDELMEFNANHD